MELRLGIYPRNDMKKLSVPQSIHGPILSVAVALVLLSPATRSPAQPFDLPDFGSSADRVISSTRERRLGKAFMKSVRKALSVIDDPLLTDYLEGLGNRLVTTSGSGTGRYHFFFVEDPAINAFAGPDGHIGVFSGLVSISQSESELAAVLAHEIAHVTQRHLLRSFEQRKHMSIPATAALIVAAVLGAQVDADLGAATAAGIQAVAVQRQINFTRDHEKEADRIGIVTLAAAGFDPYAMPGFFERLARANRAHEIGAPEFLRTHPVTTNRIADALGRADRYGHKQRPDSLRFHLVRARLRERSFGNARKAITYFQSQLEHRRYRNETAARYGYALGLARGNRIRAARAVTKKLLVRHPNQAEFIVLKARLDAELGAGERAIEALGTAVGLRPANVPLRIAYADILMAVGRPARALETLEEVARSRPGRVLIYQKMSDAALKSGQEAATHRYRAEKFYAEGDLEAAVRQLDIALRQPGLSYHDASRLQVRRDAIAQEKEDAEKGP